MARRSKVSKSILTIVKVFAILCVLMTAFVAFHYYRRQAIQTQQIQEAEAVKREAALKLIRQRKAFIRKIGPIAARVDKSYQLLPSITIAQACLESNYGQSSLSQKYNNLFGVKGFNPNTSAVMSTQEYRNGSWVTIKARFQIYDSYDAAIRAHARLFQSGTTWNPQQYRHVLAARGYQQQAKALVQDGYATDPDYADKLIRLIEQYDLVKYDR